jgi:hypothetical protein
MRQRDVLGGDSRPKNDLVSLAEINGSEAPSAIRTTTPIIIFSWMHMPRVAQLWFDILHISDMAGPFMQAFWIEPVH